MPAIYVKPFVKRQKNDRADAEAIAEAASRPAMRFVAIKGAETQGRAVACRTHQCLVRQRTQLINALRGHLAEFGIVAPKGPANFKGLEEALSDETSDLPAVGGRRTRLPDVRNPCRTDARTGAVGARGRADRLRRPSSCPALSNLEGLSRLPDRHHRQFRRRRPGGGRRGDRAARASHRMPRAADRDCHRRRSVPGSRG